MTAIVRRFQNMIPAICAALAMGGLSMTANAADDKYKTFYPEKGDPLVGDYVGRWNDEVDIDPKVAAQVIGLGDDQYRVRVVAKLDMRTPKQLDVVVEANDGVLAIEAGNFYGEIRDGVFQGGRGKKAKFEMKKVVRLSPTLGLSAPPNAEILYDGSGMDAWEEPKNWMEIPDNVMMVTPKGNTLSTKKHYKDVRLHLEFRLSQMPKSRGQGRSNSGLFLSPSYEVQILDSYGLDGVYDECGALYKVAAPFVNATAPPLQWQTYDVIYRAPRFDLQGRLEKNPTMTVSHNGVLIHHETDLGWRTQYREKERMIPHASSAGPIQLQGHGNYVQFRNMWLLDLGVGGEVSE